MYRTSLFTRIVPTIKEIGLWGPRIQKAYADMGILGFADTDLDALGEHDEEVAQDLDRRRAEVEEGRGAGDGDELARGVSGRDRRLVSCGVSPVHFLKAR
jgi:hypothetical protein